MSEGKIAVLGKTNVLHHTAAAKRNPKSGEPFANNWTYFEHSSGNFKAGIWDCTKGSWEHNHPKLEFCYIVEGSVKVIEEGGPTHVFNAGDWNRMEMQPRGPSEESHGGGWRLSTDSYRCDRYALHKDWDYSDADNADVAVADTDEQAKLYLAN